MLATPELVAARFRTEIKAELRTLGAPLKVLGLLSGDDRPSHTYASYTKKACEDLGLAYELRQVPRLELEAAILAANADSLVHGIMVYYPIFGNEQDRYLKDLVDYRKDIEGMGAFWINKLYRNQRIDPEAPEPAKAVVPCTPLAIIKLLEANGGYGSSGHRPAAGRTVTIFNRSEVVGRPLAVMMSNDGAKVYSFDEQGALLYRDGQAFETELDRTQALQASQLVITGVPSGQFPLIDADELAPGTICLNFSTRKNFTPAAEARTELFIPRVGPVTIAMCMRNVLRLHDAYQKT